MSTFAELGISKNLLKGLKELGIVSPTEVQAQVIPLVLNQRNDLVAQAQTGTGKTAAFGLPILSKIDTTSKHTQALILCPTRELGQQIAKQLFKFTKYTEKVFTEAVYGGEKIDIQLQRLARTTHVIVATPGRLIDLMERKVVNLTDVQTIVLDEADEMLKRGFKEDINKVLASANPGASKWLFSATMPKDVQEIAERFMSPTAHQVKSKDRGVVNSQIDHQYLICEEREKVGVLSQFLKSRDKQRGIVFCRTKNAARLLNSDLLDKDFEVDIIEGDMNQKERDKVMRAFRKGLLQCLIATDIAARGLDVPNLSYVVHFELADNAEYYTHRSGRTARAGSDGLSLSIITPRELRVLKGFEQRLKINFGHLKAKG